MDTNTTNSGVTESTSAPSASPAAAFGDDTPNWVKTAGLQEAHNAAKPGETVEPKVTAPSQAASPSAPVASQAQVPQAPVQQQAPTAAFDQAAMSKAIAEGIRQGQPQPQQAGPSDADLAKQLGIYTVTPEVYESILGVKPDKPEQVAALNSTMQAVARQAVNISRVLHQQDMQQMEQRFAPYLSAVRDQEAVRQRETFFQENPVLSGYEPLVKQQFDLALASGMKFNSVNDARRYVANKTLETLKAAGVTPAAQQVKSQTSSRTTTTPARTMSTTSVGGRAGGSPATKPAGTMSIWGN